MDARTLHARAAGFWLSAAAMRRQTLYRPAAALMALLMTPIVPLAGIVFVALPAPAAAQISGCVADPSSRAIIRQYCVNGVSYGPDLTELERRAVASYLGLHGLPAEDAQIVYDYGRTDLRSAVRAHMITILHGIIGKDPATRTDHERNLYNWLAALVQRNEIALYTQALNQFRLWEADPCRFTLEPTVASVNNLSYDGAIFCGSPLNSLFGGPPVPAESYFTSYGMRNSYGALSDTYPQFSGLVARTGVNVGAVAGVATAAYATIVGAASIALAVDLSAALTVFTNLGFAASVAAETGATLSGATVSTMGTGALVAGPAIIILIAVAIGVTAGMQTFERQAILDNLNNLNAQLVHAQSAPPNLAAFYNDTSGLGRYKIQMTVVSQTAPEMPATAALPVHDSSDLNFVVRSAGATEVGDTLSYEDWDGNVWTASTRGGWFVQSCAGTGCGQAASMSADFAYVDWAGVKWTASRHRDKFVSVKAIIAPGDVACPADEATGVSPGSDFTACSSYVSTEIPLRAGNGDPVHVSLSPRSAPIFSDAVSLPFNPGFASTRTITVTGNPTPQICPGTGTLPSGFSLNGNTCSTGTFQITYDGSLAGQGRHPITLSANNGVGPVVSKQFTVDFSPQLAITSPNILTIRAGFPVRFTASATGNPIPRLSLNPLLNLASLNLTFADNGDGTATISGTTLNPLGFGSCFYPDNRPCGIIATSSQGVVEQQLVVNIVEAPSARLVPPATAQFLAGVPNQVVLRTEGGATPVRIARVPNAVDPQPPAWVTLQDLGDGTAVLSGTPPLGTSGPVGMRISVVAVGSREMSIPNLVDYVINVSDQPAFTSPNVATFTAGAPGTFDITANQGTITLSGGLPPGLTFVSGNPARIGGTPAAGSGGTYTLALTAGAGSSSTARQSLRLNVNAQPKVTSANQATFIAGTPGMFAVTTTGYPTMSTLPVPAAYDPPTDPAEGKGMYFTVMGLPSGLRASNLNAQQFATGTLIIEGTPTAAGNYPVTIRAQNGVGAPIQQTLMLRVIGVTGSAPTSGLTCNGNYSGTFAGSLLVRSGQACSFIGGGVNGNIVVIGGSLSLENATVTGDVLIGGNTAFSIGQGTDIRGNLAILSASSAVSTSRVCGARVGSHLSLVANATRVTVGSANVIDCPGNVVGGHLTVIGNTRPTTVYNNVVDKNLACTANAAISGAGNVANKKQGQCSAF